jgi:Holliday junction resolvase RusA-like endonuclease
MTGRARITVPGDPIPLERARVGRGRHYLPPRSVEFRERVRVAWMEAGRVNLGAGPIACSIRFYFERPASHYGTGRNARRLKASAAAAFVGSDIDNLTKGVLDALQTLAFDNDRQVVCLAGVHKGWALRGCARCEVDLWVAQPLDMESAA